MADKFAKCLTQIRKSKDLSQSELADRIGVKTAAICHFETGFRKPTFDHLLKLAEVLGVSSVGRRVPNQGFIYVICCLSSIDFVERTVKAYFL